MQTPEADGTVLPVLIYDEQDSLIGTALANTKARNKSLEQRAPWFVDGATGRVLPWPRGGAMLAITETGDHLLFKVGAASPPPNGAGSSRSPEPVAANEQKPDRGEAVQSPEAFLFELENTIRSRQRDMPEGSYTTHLFKAGLAKIRKKTGEEAIELVLAQTPEEICGEASDLLYHLTVLFVALDIPWAKIVQTLRER